MAKQVGLGDNKGVVPLRQDPLQQTPVTGQVSGAQKAEATKLQSLDGKDSEFAPRLLEAARARDTGAAAKLMSAWLGAQSDWEVMTQGALALSNFLRVFGSGEEKPQLYADILALKPPADRAIDAGTIEMKGAQLEELGTLLQGIAQGHLSGKIDINAGDQQAAKALLIASNMGLMTDALKVKMVGWNMQTPELASGTVSFELGIRKMPEGSDTNFWVVGGVNKAVEWVNNLRVSPEAVQWMKDQPIFKNYPKEFFAYFQPPTDANGLRVKGELSNFEKDLQRVKIEALPDGEIYVGGPIMRVSGPPAAVEFIESNLMRLVTSSTTVATAAAQMTLAAGDKPVSYFGLRRAPGGGDDSIAISNAAALGGMTVTSDLLAGFLGAPLTGTMEHSIMMMLKTVLKHNPPREFTAQEKQWANDYLTSTVRAENPGISEAELAAKIKSQVADVLIEAHVFKEYSFKNDKEKAVALVDTTHPNVGVAAAMVAQQMIWAEQGKKPETTLNAIRLDSGVLLAQGLQFRKVLNDAGLPATKILATDGLLPETVKFFEGVEKELRGVKGGKLPESFYAMMKNAPESVAEDDNERAQITKMAEQLAAGGGLNDGQPLFGGYGAGEKIADSVSTVGRPGIVYKASQLTFQGEDGEPVTVRLAKTASPSKATGPERELFAIMDGDRIKQWVIGTPEEAKEAGGKAQRLMRTVYDEGQVKVNTSQKAAIEYAKTRRALLPDSVLEGAKAPLGMTAEYKERWLEIVAESNEPATVEKFRKYFDDTWPTAQLP